MNLTELHRIHARHLQAARRSPATITFYAAATAKLSAFLKHAGRAENIEEIDRATLTEFQLWLREEGLSPGGEHALLRGVRATLRWAFEEDYVPQDPTARFRMPSLPQEVPPAVQPHEVKAVLDVAR